MKKFSEKCKNFHNPAPTKLKKVLFFIQKTMQALKYLLLLRCLKIARKKERKKKG
jgi:hypothetical protein